MPTLDYARESVPRHPVEWYIVLFILTALAAATAIRIEILNAQSSFYLPRDVTTDTGKWRQSVSPRTPQEIANNHLRDLVSSWGLLQYPLTYALALAYVFTLRRFLPRTPWRLPLILSALITLVCIILMHYRGYFTALGW